jgi:hypothetical protein
MTPEKKFKLIKLLLESGAEVRTYYRRRRVAMVEKVDSHVLIRYEDSGVDKIHMRDLARRRFVAII